MKKNKLAELQARLDDLKETFKKEGEEAFKEAVKDVFAKYPTVQAFRWTQYTPYFNDGDTCTFSVNGDVDVLLAGPNEDWIESYTEGWDGEVRAASDAFGDCLSPDELMLVIFGDHAQVTCYRDRIEVDEYNHD